MGDALHCGRRFWSLNIIGEGMREALGIVVDTSLPAASGVRELEQTIRLDNYPQRNSGAK